MFLAFFVGAILYGAVTLVFLIVMSADLLDSGVSSAAGLSRVFLSSVFWPLTLIALSLAFLVRGMSGAYARVDAFPALKLVARSN